VIETINISASSELSRELGDQFIAKPPVTSDGQANDTQNPNSRWHLAFLFQSAKR